MRSVCLDLITIMEAYSLCKVHMLCHFICTPDTRLLFKTSGLADNRTLLELDLSDCGLGNEAAVHLSSIIQQNVCLRALRVTSNNLCSSGGR